jgi:peptidyl-prolyl cis-trans isomerase D
MITWMQRHKKYLIITIWISTIAFVGAGFVGWGQYSYGDKAGAVAKVGNIEISMGELQKSYSALYNQYNKVFQGDFDEERAKSFGLKAQALKQLTNQALILNLAASYDLQITDAELLAEIKAQDYFFKDGLFNKDIYKEILSRNNLSIKDYEKDVKKELLIKKTLQLLPIKTNDNEAEIFNTIMKIADKINYEVLNNDQISVDTSDDALKPFWETRQQDFMGEVSYDISFIKQEKLSNSFDAAKINEYYNENKTHFKDKDGKVLPLADAQESILEELNAKATKDLALRTYIAYKKDKLTPELTSSTATVSASNNPFDTETLQKIAELSPTSPFLKPVLFNDEYYIFKLEKINPAKVKTFEEAKKDVLPLYVEETKREQLLKLAKDSVSTFNGKTTDFITSLSTENLDGLNKEQTNEFLIQLFSQQQKRGSITLKDGKVVLYNILEQKLLKKAENNQGDLIVKLKSTMFNDGLIKNLQNKYKTEIFIQGL